MANRPYASPRGDPPTERDLTPQRATPAVAHDDCEDTHVHVVRKREEPETGRSEPPEFRDVIQWGLEATSRRILKRRKSP